MNQNFDYLLKFILIGDSSVGKSCLLNKFVQGKFINQHDPTLGVQFGCKNVVLDGLALKLQIWDTAGQQSFKSITRSYYKGSITAFLVFDLTRRQSFENINKWLNEIKNYSHEHIFIALIANKVDLAQNRVISTEQAQNFAKQNKFQYFQTSALLGTKVSQPFQSICKKILTKIKNKQINPTSQNSYGIKIGRKRQQSMSMSIRLGQQNSNGSYSKYAKYNDKNNTCKC